MASMERLKPCPFCGNKRPWIQRGASHGWVQVRCGQYYGHWMDPIREGYTYGPLPCEAATPHFGNIEPWEDVSPGEVKLWEAQARATWNRRDGAPVMLARAVWSAYYRRRKKRPEGGWVHPWTKNRPSTIKPNGEWDWLLRTTKAIVDGSMAADSQTKH